MIYQICRPVFYLLFFVSPFLLFSQDINYVSYGAHVEFEFTHPAKIAKVIIERTNDKDEVVEFNLSNSQNRYIDFLGIENQGRFFDYTFIWEYNDQSSDSLILDSVALVVQSDSALLDMVQEYTFRYFWEFAHPVSGLIRERNTSGRLVTMGGSGFGIMAILVGIHRNFITREEGYERINTMVNFLEVADRFKGVYPHWMDGSTGKVIPFSQFDDGGDLVETSFLFQGLLAARSFFDKNTAEEDLLRIKITKLWEEVNFNWYRKQTQKVLFWHWSPQNSFRINHEIRGWNESLIVYILGVGSPTHNIPASLYHDGWAANNYLNGSNPYGIELPLGPNLGGPLFFAHYSFIGFDPRGKRDQYANYFTQNRNHTLINRAYCIDNPRKHIGYSSSSWGLTASDDPGGYLAHAPGNSRDNGTISPTAAISSIPYTPKESLEALKHFYEIDGKKLWGPMGFYDAYNPTNNWVADSYLAIDQGPIICMIENYRSQLLWDNFMENEEVSIALDKIGFSSDSSTTSVSQNDNNGIMTITPNPVTNNLSINSFDFLFNQISIFTIQGRPALNYEFNSPSSNVSIDLGSLPNGIYIVRATNQHKSFSEMVVKN